MYEAPCYLPLQSLRSTRTHEKDRSEFYSQSGEKKATSTVVNLKRLTQRADSKERYCKNLRARNTEIQIALHVKGGVIEPDNTATHPGV
jgi:hypothetical protein